MNEEVDPSLVIKRLKQEIRDLKDEIRSWPNLSMFEIYIHITLSIGVKSILQLVYLVHLSTYADKLLHTLSLWSCSTFSLTLMNDIRQNCCGSAACT